VCRFLIIAQSKIKKSKTTNTKVAKQLAKEKLKADKAKRLKMLADAKAKRKTST